MSAEVEADLATDSERERVRELLGGRPERYLRSYDRMRRTGRGLVVGWSWSGSLFGGAFAFYRRLYAPLLRVEGAATLAAAAALGFAISLGAESGQAMVGISVIRWTATSFVYGLFGRALVVRDCLERLERRRRVVVGEALADVPAAWCGPLRRFRTLALAAVSGSVLVNIAVDLSTAMRDLGGFDASGPPAATESVPTTALTGIDALDLPLAMLLGASLCLLAAVVLWRRSRRGDLIWPCSGAIAAGVVATAIVGMMPELVLPLRELLSPDMAAARHQLPLDRARRGVLQTRPPGLDHPRRRTGSEPSRAHRRGSPHGSGLRYRRDGLLPFLALYPAERHHRPGAAAAPAVRRHHRSRPVLARCGAAVVETSG